MRSRDPFFIETDSANPQPVSNVWFENEESYFYKESKFTFIVVLSPSFLMWVWRETYFQRYQGSTEKIKRLRTRLSGGGGRILTLWQLHTIELILGAKLFSSQTKNDKSIREILLRHDASATTNQSSSSNQLHWGKNFLWATSLSQYYIHHPSPSPTFPAQLNSHLFLQTNTRLSSYHRHSSTINFISRWWRRCWLAKRTAAAPGDLQGGGAGKLLSCPLNVLEFTSSMI